MKRGHRSARGVLILGAALVLLGILPSTGRALDIQVHPASLKIEGFFGGVRLRASGAIPEGTEAVIEVIGPKTEQELMRKGRRWDLWMNMGEIDIRGVPGFYLVASSDPQLLSAGGWEKPWGYGLWQRRARFQGAFQKGEEALIFQEFVLLKEGTGFFGRFPGAVQVVSAVPGRSQAQATFPINTRIAPGAYRIRVTAVRGQQIVERHEVQWRVELAGSPAFLIYLALERPVLYGIMALGLAATIGFLSGVLFKQREKGGRE